MVKIASHILAADFPLRPEGYREVIVALGDVGILPGAFADRFAGMAGFRNVLIHEYMTVNLDTVYDHLQDNLDDFRLFSRYVTDYLASRGALEA